MRRPSESRRRGAFLPWSAGLEDRRASIRTVCAPEVGAVHLGILPVGLPTGVRALAEARLTALLEVTAPGRGSSSDFVRSASRLLVDWSSLLS